MPVRITTWLVQLLLLQPHPRARSELGGAGPGAEDSGGPGRMPLHRQGHAAVLGAGGAHARGQQPGGLRAHGVHEPHAGGRSHLLPGGCARTGGDGRSGVWPRREMDAPAALLASQLVFCVLTNETCALSKRVRFAEVFCVWVFLVLFSY